MCNPRGEQGQPFHRRTALSVILFLCRLFRQGELQDQIRQHTRQHRSQYDTHLCLRQQHRRIPEREVGYEQRNRKTDTSQRQIPVRFTQVMPFSSPANPIFITSQVKK